MHADTTHFNQKLHGIVFTKHFNMQSILEFNPLHNFSVCVCVWVGGGGGVVQGDRRVDMRNMVGLQKLVPL